MLPPSFLYLIFKRCPKVLYRDNFISWFSLQTSREEILKIKNVPIISTSNHKKFGSESSAKVLPGILLQLAYVNHFNFEWLTTVAHLRVQLVVTNGEKMVFSRFWHFEKQFAHLVNENRMKVHYSVHLHCSILGKSDSFQSFLSLDLFSETVMICMFAASYGFTFLCLEWQWMQINAVF